MKGFPRENCGRDMRDKRLRQNLIMGQDNKGQEYERRKNEGCE